ncbi:MULTISPECIES: polyprenyl synthetase family protein [unclassified Archaeoglobus]|jgi:geranylgeranyl diphosphate synthase type I|uniref:polyprenyl synthetase family protein n=1 Tax=unclassified Archaeoglobus TaxID=2643606 RepID=UPI0025C2C4C2|nr:MULTISPECIES: polyprenyl synthetase family protein [unclassified Archaeoglobus]
MLKDEIEKRAEIINRAIERFLPEMEPEGLYSAARHLIKAGGKRLRPVISLLIAEALGKDYKRIIPAAVSVETVHNFTLVHDDIMDRDEMRRGVPTVHRVYGEATAILAGDTLFAEAFKLLTKCDTEPENIVKAVETLSNVCIKICEGQYMDMSFESRDVISEEEYLEMVKLKTGVLIAASSSLPAILLGEDEDVVNSLWEYGILSGIAFQIHDDVLDLTENTGKDWGSDLLKGKKTLIVIKAFEDGVKLNTFGKQVASEEEIRYDIEKLKKCGAIDYAVIRAREYAEQAKERLTILPESDAREVLIELTDYLVRRKK